MSDPSSNRTSRPSLRGSTASCWGLLGTSLTWNPEPDDDQDRDEDRLIGGTVGTCDADGVWTRVIDVAEAERQARASSPRSERR